MNHAFFLASLILLGALVHSTKADIAWPEYSQQCQDDAGPPYADDDPNGKYHDGSAAYPVLQQNGECADPMKDACDKRPDAKTAYLEGPISCGGNGWYCRIFNDEANGWANINLNGDVNFGQCNREESFEDAGFDQDGHCHGSSDDSTYYWWIRDHWHRQYNGKVRCCCGWFQGGTQPLYSGRIANRCDYRRVVTRDENVNNCRDANEDHNMGFDDIGCDPQYRNQIGQPIPEDDSVCWEIERFGFTEEGGSVPTTDPASSPTTRAPVGTPNTPSPVVNTTPAPTPSPVVSSTPEPSSATTEDDNVEGGCVDSPLRMKVGRMKRTCDWVASRKERRCDKTDVSSHCPATCDECDFWGCSDSDKWFYIPGVDGRVNCDMVAEDEEYCEEEGVAETCRETCEYCS